MDRKLYISNSINSSRKSAAAIQKDAANKKHSSLPHTADILKEENKKPQKSSSTKFRIPTEWAGLCVGVCLGFAVLLSSGEAITTLSSSDGIADAGQYLSDRINEDSRLSEFFSIENKNKNAQAADSSEIIPELPAFVYGQKIDADEYIKKYNQLHYSHSGALPVHGTVSSKFAFRKNPFYNVYDGEAEYEFHSGIDIAASEGSNIVSYLDGVVEKAALSSDYGYYAVIDHGNGMKTLYAHASKLMCEEGDEVLKGEVIALVGSTGRATGPHLHFEVIKDGEKTDPAEYLKELF